jgi:hypothetical protein
MLRGGFVDEVEQRLPALRAALLALASGDAAATRALLAHVHALAGAAAVIVDGEVFARARAVEKDLRAYAAAGGPPPADLLGAVHGLLDRLAGWGR